MKIVVNPLKLKFFLYQEKLLRRYHSLKNDQKLLAIAQNGKTIHFLAKRNKLTQVLGSCYAKNIEKSSFFKHKLALTQKTPVLTYQTQYVKIFLGIRATILGRSLLIKIPASGSKWTIFVIRYPPKICIKIKNRPIIFY